MRSRLASFRWAGIPRARTALFALLGALVLLAGTPASAAAHAYLEEADPAPNAELAAAPDRVTIHFSEPIAPAFSDIQVLNSAGERVDGRDSTVPRDDLRQLWVSLPPVPDGTYTVTWRNVSVVDGHALRGWYVFSVGEPIDADAAVEDETPAVSSPFEPIARWLALLGALALAGGVVFDRTVAAPALARLRENAAASRLSAAHRRWLARLLAGGLVLWALGTLLHLGVQLHIVTDGPVHRAGFDALSSLIVDTTWGRAWAARALLLAASAVLLWRWLTGRSGAGALVLVVLGALFSMSVASHGAALTALGPAGLTNDFLHLIAASTWVGGLFAMVVLVRLARLGLADGERRAFLGRVAPRFSVAAVLSVGVLVLTGLFMGWMHVHDPAASGTPYGRTLTLKVTLFLTMLAIGAVNLLWTGGEAARSERGGQWLRRLVSVEAVIAVVVILATGVLTSMEPARSAHEAQAEEREFVETVDDVTATLRLRPGDLGPNDLTVLLTDRRGDPVEAQQASLRFSYLEADIGDLTIDAEQAGPGRFEVEAVQLGVGGNWRIQVVAPRADGFDVRVGFVAPVGDVAGEATPLPVDTGRAIWVAQWIALGALFHGVAWRLRGRHATATSAFQWTGTACLVAVIFVATNTSPFRMTEPLPDVNPLPASSEVLERGEALFAQHCAACHGPEGYGDGPQAAALPRPPSDLRIHVPLHTDRELFAFVRDGIPEVGMPAFADALTEEDTWSLLHYLRATFEEADEASDAAAAEPEQEPDLPTLEADDDADEHAGH